MRRSWTLYLVALLFVSGAGSLLPSLPLAPPFPAPPSPSAAPLTPDTFPAETHEPPGSAENPTPGQALPDSPLNDLILRLTYDGKTPANVSRAFRIFYHDSGYAVPADLEGMFDGNSSVSYSYPLGDINGDGFDDFALDQYCAAWWDCSSGGGLVEFATRFQRTGCGGGVHRLVAVNGKDGSPIWQWDYHLWDTEPWQAVVQTAAFVPIIRCDPEFVVGVANTITGPQVIVYRMFLVGVNVFEHRLYALDMNGRVVWQVSNWGHWEIAFVPGSPYVINPSAAFAATNLTILPFLDAPQQKGVRWQPSQPFSSLFLRSVGGQFAIIVPDTYFCLFVPFQCLVGPIWITPFPGGSRDPAVALSSQPDEWAARVDLLTGKYLWQTATFKPSYESGRSVAVPTPNDRAWNAATSLPRTKAPGEQYWSFRPNCCGDLDGDGVPDLVYTTMEWTSYRASHPSPHELPLSRLIVRSGINGSGLYASILQSSSVQATAYYPEPVGDLDADGLPDILLHALPTYVDGWHQLSARSGRDGHELWRHTTARLSWTVPLGGANQERGNLLALYEVFPRRAVVTKAETASSTEQGADLDFLYNWDLTNLTRTRVTVFEGRDGKVAWRGEAIMAMVDVLFIYQTLQLNGLPDLDGDGVGEIPLDRLLVLGDLTYIHRYDFHSGATGVPLRRYTGAGQASFPALAGDVNQDGMEDLCNLNGDIADLWMTCYDAKTSQALWARRMLAPRVAGYVLMIPRIQLNLAHNSSGLPAVFANVHLTVATSGGGGLGSSTSTQLAMFVGQNGTAHWSNPNFWDQFSEVAIGHSPGTQAYLLQFETPDPTAVAKAGQAGLQLGTITGFAVVPLLVGHMLGRRVWRKKGGVA